MYFGPVTQHMGCELVIFNKENMERNFREKIIKGVYSIPYKSKLLGKEKDIINLERRFYPVSSET